MTCIVGVAHEGVVIIGADSAGVSGTDLVVRRDKKVFRNGELVMGFTTSFRMGQLLQYMLTPPEFVEDEDPFVYVVKRLIPAIRSTLKEGGWMTVENDNEKGGSFLLGVRGRLFAIHADLQVAEGMSQSDAVGCGELIARGALFATQGQPPLDRIVTALEAAAEYSAGVRRPFFIESTHYK